MPRIVTVSRLTQNGKFSKLAVQGAGLDAIIHHSDGEFYMLSGKGSKSRSNEIVGAARAFIAAEELAAEADWYESLNTPALPAPVVPFSAEVDAALLALKAGDFHGAAVIHQSLFKKWIDGVSDITETLDRLDLLAADVLNVNIVIRQDWAAWLEAGPIDNRRQTLTPICTTCDGSGRTLPVFDADDVSSSFHDTCIDCGGMGRRKPAAPAFTTFTDFTPGKHLQCAVCGFETIYTDARRRTVSYVIADGLTVDVSTTERDSTVRQSDVTGIECNRIGCGWKGPALLPAGYAAAVEIETAQYRHHVALSDAFFTGPAYGADSWCRYHMVQAAESLQRLQAWAADPASYNFSELAGVTA